MILKKKAMVLSQLNDFITRFSCQLLVSSIQLTCDAPVAGFQVGGEVPLAWSNVDQTSDADVT